MTTNNHPLLPPELDDAYRTTPHKRRTAEGVWRLLGHLHPLPLDVPEADAAWTAVQTRLDVPPRATFLAPDRTPRPHRASLRGIMATALAVLVVGLWLWRQPVTVSVPPGVQQTVNLPDGSTVHLNSASRLQYTRGFASWPFVPAAERHVYLDGEAFFDIVPAERTFRIETFNAQVEVLGTTFSVRARNESSARATQVVLASGTVRVAARQRGDAPGMVPEPIVLHEPGQQARVTDTPEAPVLASSHLANIEPMLAWRRQGFAVVDEPLAAIFAEIERRYAVSIEIEDSFALTDSTNLFYPRGTSASKILHDICLAHRCRYEPTSQGFLLRPAASSKTTDD